MFVSEALLEALNHERVLPTVTLREHEHVVEVRDLFWCNIIRLVSEIVRHWRQQIAFISASKTPLVQISGLAIGRGCPELTICEPFPFYRVYFLLARMLQLRN